MAEIRGCDLVTEYLIKEKVPYLFGYAGHGAVGLLDGVYNHQDSGALQEEYRHYQADFPSIARVITKRSFQAQSVEDLGKFLPKAFKLARTGRPGPVHIDVPYDLWIRTADVEVPEPEERSSMLSWRTPGEPEAVARALELLLKGKRPLILAGGGVIASDATTELRAF